MERVKLYLEENNPQQVNIDNIIKEYKVQIFKMLIESSIIRAERDTGKSQQEIKNIVKSILQEEKGISDNLVDAFEDNLVNHIKIRVAMEFYKKETTQSKVDDTTNER